MSVKRVGSLPEQEHSSEHSLEKLYTERELADLGIASVSKLRKDRMKGTGIPFIQIGRLVRYRGSDVDAFLALNRATRTMTHTDPAIRQAELSRMQKVSEARASKRSAEIA